MSLCILKTFTPAHTSNWILHPEWLAFNPRNISCAETGAVEVGELLLALVREEEARWFAGWQHLSRAAQMHKLLGEVRWISWGSTDGILKSSCELVHYVVQGGAGSCFLWYVHQKWMKRLLLLWNIKWTKLHGGFLKRFVLCFVRISPAYGLFCQGREWNV